MLTLVLSLVLLVQGPGPATSGTFVTSIGGNRFGSEKYTFTRQADGTTRAEAEFQTSASVQKTVTVFTAERPVRFTREAGAAVLVNAEFTGEQVKLRLPGGVEKIESAKVDGVLENLLWHHYLPLLARAGDGEPKRFAMFVPSTSREVGVTVERGSPVTVPVAGKPVTAGRYRVVLGERVAVDAWTDPAGVPFLFRIESQQVRAVREDAQALADAVLTAATAPAAEAPFRSEEVTFQNGDTTLAGTLTLPKSGAPPFPAALILSGTGAQDRDGNPGGGGLYRTIADKLSAAGMAVLRADDRGAGKSTLPDRPLTYDDLVGDSRAGMDFLRTRKEIDPKRLVLIGHSEGAQTAALLASRDPQVAAIVLLAGTSRPLDQVALEQARYQAALARPHDLADGAQLPGDSQAVLDLIEQAKSGKKAKTATDYHEYFRQHLKLDPRKTARLVKCPVLILQGERDPEVLAYHALELAAALAEGGNKRVTVRVLPGLSHLFTPSPLEKGLPYDVRNRVSPEMLDTLAGWLDRTLGQAAPAPATPEKGGRRG